MIAIHDKSHCEIVAECETFDEALGELRLLASTPWDEAPDQCPCTSWRTCGRDYELCEIDDSQLPWKWLQRTSALKISRHGVKWAPDIEAGWRSAAS